jgi:hypothetical protein
MKRSEASRILAGIVLLLLLLIGQSTSAARLEADRNELIPGEVTSVHLKGAPLIAIVDWKVSPELELIDSDSRHARVRGKRAGTGKVTCEMNLKTYTLNIGVRSINQPIPEPIFAPPAWQTSPPPAPPAPLPQAAPAAAASQDTLAGVWEIDANGYTGKLELASTQGMLIGRVRFDAHAVWEPLEDVYFDTSSQELSFTRPGASQTYRGRLQGDMLEGRFNQWSGREYSASAPAYAWSARRGGKVLSDVMPSAAPTVIRETRVPRIVELTWLDMADDRVGERDDGRPNGTPDGHLLLKLEVLDPQILTSLSLWSANEQGEKSGGQVWHSRKQLYWLLGVFSDGRQISTRHVENLGRFHGNITLDLYANSSGWFKPGQSFVLELENDDGRMTTQVLRIPAKTPAEASAVTAKRVLEDDLGPYQWIEASQVQSGKVQSGRAAFRSTGNNHFLHRLGIVGDASDQFRYLDFWIYLDNPSADVQLQVQVDDVWARRWGFDADASYNGYGWDMQGASTGLASGRWLHQRIDLMQQLGIHAGQAITGLAFSSDAGDAFYDTVYLLPNAAPTAKPQAVRSGKRILEDDLGPYNWIERSSVQKEVVAYGDAAFRSTGNNHFLADLGEAGSGSGQYRQLDFWAFFVGPEADLQVQVQVNGSWGKRWGYDAGPSYNGYSWEMQGSTARVPHDRWTPIRLDLLSQLQLQPGDRITGLAFSSDQADVFYDSVYLIPATQ